MSIRVAVADVLALEAEGLVLGLFAGERLELPSGAMLDQAANGLISHVLEAEDFDGEAGSILMVYAPEARLRRVALVGLGSRAGVTCDSVRRAVGLGVRKLRDCGAKTIALLVECPAIAAVELAQAATEAAMLSLYRMDAYRTRDRDTLPTVDELQVWVPAGAEAQEVEHGVAVGRILAESMRVAQDLTAHPGNVATPSHLADVARAVGQEVGLRVRVFERAELEALGFRTLLAVNRASAEVEPARFIVMEWDGGPSGEAPIAIVGKAVTFDSGGISIKPSAGMELMKFDMGGGASTIAIMRCVAALGLKRNIVGLVPATENMVGASALKPGDIIRTYAGLTVEVNNTDAEGRLILADALAYAVDAFQPEAVIDMATLTGACIMALGNDITAAIGNNDELVHRLVSAGAKSGEPMWQLPLWPAYRELIQSDIADLKNSGGREAGTITAASFLSEFVAGTPWCHLDIAGTAWVEKDKPHQPEGPTGAPVRAVVAALQAWQPLTSSC